MNNVLDKRLSAKGHHFEAGPVSTKEGGITVLL